MIKKALRLLIDVILCAIAVTLSGLVFGRYWLLVLGQVVAAAATVVGLVLVAIDCRRDLR